MGVLYLKQEIIDENTHLIKESGDHWAVDKKALNVRR